MLKSAVFIAVFICVIGVTSGSQGLKVDTKVSSVECTVCEWLVQMAEGYVASNQSEQFILKELDAVCAQLVVTYIVDAVRLQKFVFRWLDLVLNS
jgi:hypothetical protein